MFFKTSDHIKINYHLEGKGKPIVLITGFGGYQEIWYKQVEYLSKMGYQVLTFDHRNMGKSQRTKKGLTLERLAQDMTELLNFLQIEQTVFIAHSMGGSVLYDLLGMNPNLIKLGIILDQSPYMLNTQSWSYGFMNLTPKNYRWEIKKVPKVRETLHGIDQEIANKLFPVKIKFPFKREDNLDLLTEHSRLDWRPIVEKTKTPLLVMAARQSPYYDWHFSQWMAAHNSKIKANIIENSGHDIMAEVPTRTNQLLRHYLLKNHYLPN